MPQVLTSTVSPRPTTAPKARQRLGAGLSCFLAGVALSGAVASVQAAEPTPFQACANQPDAAQRLACYDRLLPPGAAAPATASPTTSATPPPAAAVAPYVAETVPVTPFNLTDSSMLGERWAIGVPADKTLFDIRPHKPTYILLGRYSDSVNEQPTTPSQPLPPIAVDLDSVEAKFQISFKFKLADFTESFGASLWGAYTQQNNWQVYNDEISRPFRETNYEPELMLAWHPGTDLGGGWKFNLFDVGLVHQSNGRADPLSRSWNRLYVQAGIERDNFALLVRPWYRFKESGEDDDNPDITDYLGHGDLLAVWRLGGHTLSALGRYNFATGKGAVQASWSFPLVRRVQGYVQVFSGYGESLIDYNWNQTTIGVGFSLADWM